MGGSPFDRLRANGKKTIFKALNGRGWANTLVRPYVIPEGNARKDMGNSPEVLKNPYFLGIALWSTFGIMYVTGKCPGASFTILALEVKHRTA
jgi:hypothetical protein